MAKKLKLHIKNKYDYKDKYKIIGICSHLKDYRICWNLNKKLDFRFKKIKDIKFEFDKKIKNILFSLYHQEEKDFITYYLISNHILNKILIPEQRQLDYILIIKGPINTLKIQSIIKKIRQINNVLTAYNIDMSLVKKTDDILFDLELHILNVKEKKKK